MNYKESLEYFARKPWVKPIDIVLAFQEPQEINAVTLAGVLRYRITQEITREEFMAQLKANLQRSNFVATQGVAVNSRVDLDSTKDVAEPGPEFRYFYRAECV